jgi:hypothetical protein
MIILHPQFIKYSAGDHLVILQKKEFDLIIEQLEEFEDIRLFDQALKEDTGERIPMEEAFKMRETRRELK